MSDNKLKICLISLASIFLISNPAKAQLIPGLSFAQIRLTPDRTLGRESSTVVPVLGTNRDNIEGGARRGTNLFHSFREFNVNSVREVYFNNPSGVRNIINRVTGSNISNIFGTLGVNGNANLYLINPNGIVFGEGAKLDINGTFIGTTADGVRLGTNDVYSASDPASSSLLTIQPEALFVNRKNAIKRAIINRANLQLNPGANLTLSADRIENSGAIRSSGGNIFLKAINLNFNTGVISRSTGDININSSSLSLVNGGAISNGGDININSDFIFFNERGISSNGGININSSFLSLINGARISNISGDININSSSFL